MNAYIIHLSKIQNSLNSALRLQKELLDVNIRAQLFEGSYGDRTIKHYAKKDRTHHNWTFKGPDKICTEEQKLKQTHPGIIGCFDSHYRLWKKCIKENQPIMIFEDDASIVRQYHPVEFDDVLSLVFSHNKKMAKYIDHLENPNDEIKACDYKPSSMPGNAGYIIKPHAAEILINEYKNSFLPADNAINQWLVKIQIHSHMMGKAIKREKTNGKSSLIRTKYWTQT